MKRQKFGAGFNRRGRARNLSRPAADQLPPPLREALFEPRPPLPASAEPEPTPVPPLSGLAELMCKFEQGPPPPKPAINTPAARREAAKAGRVAAAEAALAERAAAWDPKNDPKVTSDAFKTLFVGRLPYEFTEDSLREEMSRYGKVNSVRLVCDPQGKSRGYGFVEFNSEDDLRAAYRHVNGLRILGRAVLADVERGRTVVGWKPRYLGGGGGDGRKALPKQDKAARQRAAAQQHGGRPHQRNRSRDGSSRGRYEGRQDRGGYGGGGGGGRQPYERFDARRPRYRSRSRSPPRRAYRRSRSPPRRRY